ncbi:hypothetical protein ACMFMF_006033 [Clarireedia jacksonii]
MSTGLSRTRFVTTSRRTIAIVPTGPSITATRLAITFKSSRNSVRTRERTGTGLSAKFSMLLRMYLTTCTDIELALIADFPAWNLNCSEGHFTSPKYDDQKDSRVAEAIDIGNGKSVSSGLSI